MPFTIIYYAIYPVYSAGSPATAARHCQSRDLLGRSADSLWRCLPWQGAKPKGKLKSLSQLKFVCVCMTVFTHMYYIYILYKHVDVYVYMYLYIYISVFFIAVLGCFFAWPVFKIGKNSSKLKYMKIQGELTTHCKAYEQNPILLQIEEEVVKRPQPTKKPKTSACIPYTVCCMQDKDTTQQLMLAHWFVSATSTSLRTPH